MVAPLHHSFFSTFRSMGLKCFHCGEVEEHTNHRIPANPAARPAEHFVRSLSPQEKEIALESIRKILETSGGEELVSEARKAFRKRPYERPVLQEGGPRAEDFPPEPLDCDSAGARISPCDNCKGSRFVAGQPCEACS